MRFLEYENCTACTACMTVCPEKAIEMKEDEEGFLYPVIKAEYCNECGVCGSVCPMINHSKDKDSSYEIKAYAIKHQNQNVLRQSTSGGMFTALSDYVLQNKGAVYGAILDNSFRIKHIRATTEAERDLMRGSKYVQSDLGNVFSDIIKDLRENKQVLFIGTPCQVDGLKHILSPTIDKRNLILVDIICNGVPSPGLFFDYISYCEKMQKKKIIRHDFRPKDYGWGHIEHNVFADGTIDNISVFSQAWRFIFYSGNAHRKSCYNCPYTNINRVSDITLGDFWGIELTDLQINREDGVSVCFINSEIGREVLENISNCLEITCTTVKDAIIKQPRMRGVCAKADRRNEFWNEYKMKGAMYVIEKYGRCTVYIRFKHWLKRVFMKMLNGVN